VNEGKRSEEADRVEALGAMCSLHSKQKLAVQTRLEMQILTNEDKEQWIENHVVRDTAVVRK